MNKPRLQLIQTDQINTNKTRERSAKLANGLTLKQETFCQCVVKGMSMAASYREAFNTSKMQPSTIHERASVLFAQDKIKARIAELNRLIESKPSHDPASLRRLALDTMIEVARDPKSSRNEKLKAIELLGKVNTVQLFNEISTVKTERLTDEQASEKLKALLEAMQPVDNKG